MRLRRVCAGHSETKRLAVTRDMQARAEGPSACPEKSTWPFESVEVPQRENLNRDSSSGSGSGSSSGSSSGESGSSSSGSDSESEAERPMKRANPKKRMLGGKRGPAKA